ncbi:MAG TPA: lamin tail domain-containing protein, partial [Chitinophagaceae bacterium]|nr:lamin tail domain-containing protein [Chitinophagaceae bacterium]
SGGGTFSGNRTLTDATASITLYTSSNAVFAADALPADAKTWTGYCNAFNSTKEFAIRNASDVADNNPPPPPGDADFIISEYIEGSSYNKYLEIYNAGTSAADLSKYIVKLYVNGETNASNSTQLDTLTGSLSLVAGGLIVIRNSKAALSLPAGITAYVSSVCSFNGDDAITIEKDGTVIDMFGDVGTDPGTSWTISGSSSAAVDKTIRRNLSVVKGNTNWTNSSSSEWDLIAATDDVSNLGTR